MFHFIQVPFKDIILKTETFLTLYGNMWKLLGQRYLCLEHPVTSATELTVATQLHAQFLTPSVVKLLYATATVFLSNGIVKSDKFHKI